MAALRDHEIREVNKSNFMDSHLLRFRESEWVGNKWSSIDIEPNDVNYFPRILFHLSATYHFPHPQVICAPGGYIAKFEVLGSKAAMHLDTWTFSIAFETRDVREQVIAMLRALPSHYFEITH